jgi:hypothetical protein
MSLSVLASLILAAAAQDAGASQPQVTAPPATTDPAAGQPNPQQVQDTSAPQSSPPAAPQPTPTAARLDDRSLPTQSAVVRYDAAFFAAMHPISAKDMIQRLPGFAFKDVDPSVRGFAGAGGNVLFDGDRPTTKNESVDQMLARIPASQIDHIDVIRGGAPGIDMQGQTVVANIVRKKGASTSGYLHVANSANYDGRQFPQVQLQGQKRWDGHAIEASVIWAAFLDDGAGDGPTFRYDPNGNLIRSSQLEATADGYQLTPSAAYETPLWGGKLRLSVNGQIQVYDDDEDDTLRPPPGTEFLRYHQYKTNAEANAHYEKDLGPKWGLEMLAIQQYDTQDNFTHFFTSGETPDVDDLFDEQDTYGETIGRAIVRYKPSGKLTIEATGEGAYNWLDTDTSFVENGAPIALPAASVRVEEKRAEGSLQATWKPSEKLTVEGGMRVEVSSISSSGDVLLEKTLTFPKPRVVVTWSPDPKNQLRLRAEREVGQLNFRDFVANSALNTGSVQAGNPDIEPGSAWVGEATYEHRFWGSAVASVGWIHSELQDVVDRVPVFDPNDPTNVFDAPGNIGDGREDDITFGLTLPLDRLGLKRAQIKGSGTFRWSEVTDPTTGEKRRISGQHPWDFEWHFSQDIPRWKVNWGIDLFNRWTETYYRFNEVDRFALKAFVAVYAEWKPQPDLAFRFGIDNLTGRGFERDVTLYGGPRNTSPLLFNDFRYQGGGQSVYMRVRKMFGS